MTRLSDFTTSVEQSDELNPTIRKWLYGTRDLQQRLSERIIFLSRCFDQIPANSLSRYADILIEALNSNSSQDACVLPKHLSKSICQLADYLDTVDDPEVAAKARLIREAIGGVCSDQEQEQT